MEPQLHLHTTCKENPYVCITQRSSYTVIGVSVCVCVRVLTCLPSGQNGYTVY